MTFRIRKLATLVSLALVFLLSPPLYAQTSGGSNGMSATEHDKLKQEIVKEVIDQLQTSGVLQEAVQQGIHDFIVKQQQAQLQARKKQQAAADKRAESVRPVSVTHDHIYGNPKAEVSLIEYSDFECPFCKRFHPTTEELVDQSDGKVNLVYRQFPLSFHANAEKEAEASECAAALGGNKAFWAFANAIFKRTTSNGHGFPLSQIVPLATQIGLNKEKFKDCYDSGRYKARVKADLADGVRIGVAGTPGNILLDHKTGKALMRPGVQSLDTLVEDVKMLTKGDDQGTSQSNETGSGKSAGQSCFGILGLRRRAAWPEYRKAPLPPAGEGPWARTGGQAPLRGTKARRPARIRRAESPTCREAVIMDGAGLYRPSFRLGSGRRIPHPPVGEGQDE